MATTQLRFGADLNGPKFGRHACGPVVLGVHFLAAKGSTDGNQPPITGFLLVLRDSMAFLVAQQRPNQGLCE